MRLQPEHEVGHGFQNNIKFMDLALHSVAGTMTPSWRQKRRSPESELP
jgi:hypothetical protein